MHESPVFDVYFKNILRLFIRVCAWCLTRDNKIYSKYIKNVIFSNLEEELTGYCMREIIKNDSM